MDSCLASVTRDCTSAGALIGASVVVVVATVGGGSGEVDVVDGFACEVVGATMTSAGDDTAAMP